MWRQRGEILYKIYRALTSAISPVISLHLRWRRFRGLEHPTRWPERLGRPSVRRPPGPLVWFHAVSLGEGMAAIPVVKCFVTGRPDVTILMTSTTMTAFEVLKSRLPIGVIYQFAPLDTPVAVEAFLSYWKPKALIILESELWPNLIMGAAKNGIALALLNARISAKSFQHWSLSVVLPLAALLLSKFSLIVPLSNLQAIQFQLLQAPPFVISFSGDLKFALDDSSVSQGNHSLQELQEQLTCRKHAQQIAMALQKKGITVALRSRGDTLSLGTQIYIVDTLGELRELYQLSPVAVIGGSFLPGLTGHNISEAAKAGCAILTGHYVGHFNHMVQELQRMNSSSVLQVSEDQLVKALIELFSDANILEARRMAAKQAFHGVSRDIVENTWSLVQSHILDKGFRK